MAVSPAEANSSGRPSNVRGANRDLIGLKFPFQRSEGEFPARVRNIDCVTSDLLMLFRSSLRERPMRPEHGTNVHSLVFESRGDLLNARLQRAVRQAIALNEPRVNVLSIDISEQDTKIDVFVVYEVQGVRQSVTITLPTG